MDRDLPCEDTDQMRHLSAKLRLRANSFVRTFLKSSFVAGLDCRGRQPKKDFDGWIKEICLLRASGSALPVQPVTT